MQDDKHFNWPGGDVEAEQPETNGNGGEVFRNWMSRGPSGRRRASFDPSLYTWKGYRQWKDGVDKQWSEDTE